MFEPGERVFLPGASGEPTGLVAPLFASAGVHVTTSFVPGVNRLPPILERAARTTGLFAYPGADCAHLPVSYAGFVRLLTDGDIIDTAVVQLSPPGADGMASFGPAAEFGPLALRVARRRIAVINPSVAPGGRAPRVALAAFDAVVEHAAPLRTYGAGAPDAVATAIADHVARFVVDGATLQVGLGKTPAALMAALGDRRRLRLHSGMLSDGARRLADAGALDPDHRHLTTVFLGSEALYPWAARQDLIEVAGCEVTHDPRRLAAIEGLVAVNSALEVDLFGQCNLESAAGRQVSGCGGAPDFARAARLSPGGLSIVALPASFGDAGSRVCARFAAPGLATLPRHDVDLVVTEHGVADLRAANSDARAEALIAIAPPPARARLADQWREIRQGLGL